MEKKDGGFARLLWQFLDGSPQEKAEFRSTKQVPAETALSRQELFAPAAFQVLRPDHRRCVHAGDRHGQRTD